jgi:hypothetical protein
MSRTAADWNAQVIDEFLANQGHVGGSWDQARLLLHHTGASRVNPLGYLPDDRRYLIFAANGGAPRNPAWWHTAGAPPPSAVRLLLG